MKELKPLGITAGILAVFAVAGSLFTQTSFWSFLTLGFAIWFYIVLPGYMILMHTSLASFQKIIIGSAISTAIVPVILYGMDIINIPLSRVFIAIVILIISVISYFKK